MLFIKYATFEVNNESAHTHHHLCKPMAFRKNRKSYRGAEGYVGYFLSGPLVTDCKVFPIPHGIMTYMSRSFQVRSQSIWILWLVLRISLLGHHFPFNLDVRVGWTKQRVYLLPYEPFLRKLKYLVQLTSLNLWHHSINRTSWFVYLNKPTVYNLYIQ